MNRIFIVIYIISIFSFLHSPLLGQDSSPTMEYATIDVLVVFYTNTAGAKMSAQEIKQLKKGISLSREFYWRNSGCQLHLNISYMEIEDFKSKKFFPEDGLLWPKFVEQDFRDNGIKDNQYGVIVLVYGPPAGGGNYGGMKILGETGYSFFRFPCKTSVLYPGEDEQVNYKATWLFTHELQHSLDLICYQNSGAEFMWHGDKPLDFAIQAGEQFSYQAEIFRQFKDYLRIKSPWGKIDRTGDNDRDGIPDNNARLPFDEARFGSDSTLSDTDGDGLDDLAELMAGIYCGSDPNNIDTDHDGFSDSSDDFPLHTIHSKIPEITPYFDGDWSTWFPGSDTLAFSSSKFLLGNPLKAQFYMNWDSNFVYIGCEMNAPAELHIDMDMMNNGWWHGSDNYRFVVDPYSSRFSQIRVMDTSDEVRQYRDSLGNGPYEMWDDDPQYINKFGKILEETSVELITEVFEDNYLIKIKIPKNDRINFYPKKAHKIGMRVYFTAPDIGSINSWATLYDLYEFFDISLE